MDYLKIAMDKVAEDYPAIVYAKPQLSDLPKGTIIGTWTYSSPGNVRFVLDKQRELAPGVMPADVTRAWIRDEYKLPLRRRKSQFNSHYVLPLHAEKGLHGDCSYVDIKGAYLNTLKFGYDLEYVRGKYLAVNPVALPDIIRKNKFCYSIGVAMSNSVQTNISVVGNNGLFGVKKFNIFSNPCLYAFTCELLASVASEVMALMGNQVHYINTDGYIVPTKYAHYLIDIINSWGLECGVKAQGETEVYGVASWRVGDERTSRMNPSAKSFTSVMPDQAERHWLKNSFVKLEQMYGTILTG